MRRSEVKAMIGLKFTHVVVVLTTATLLLQMLLLYSNQCYFSRLEGTQGRGIGDLQRVSKDNLNYVLNFTRPQQVNTKQERPSAFPVPRNKRRLTIGIPTVKRRDGEYFSSMLDTMLNKTSEEEMKEIVFVIFLADINNTDWKFETEAKIREKYEKYVTAGSLQVIQAPLQFYNGMVQSANDSYMNWRTKQNYDYAFLMRYCQNISEYYMQMEDDVQASDGYFDAIFNFTKSQLKDDWICLEFSELGFIGKLYHSKHIGKLADMLLLFSHTQPVDYTYIYFNILMGNGLKRIRKPTLFQHIGFHSSLADKVQPLVDKYFDFPEKELKGDNPPAKIFTTLMVNEEFPTNLAYSHEPGHFWTSEVPKENDTFSLFFHIAQIIDKIVIISGSKSHPKDIIHNGVLEAGVLSSGNDEKMTCEGLITLGHFQNGSISVDSEAIRSNLGLVSIRCLQIRFTMSQREWVVIKEIAIFTSHM